MQVVTQAAGNRGNDETPPLVRGGVSSQADQMRGNTPLRKGLGLLRSGGFSGDPIIVVPPGRAQIRGNTGGWTLAICSSTRTTWQE